MFEFVTTEGSCVTVKTPLPVTTVDVHGAPVVALKPEALVHPAGKVVTPVVHGAPVVELNIAPAAHPGTLEVEAHGAPVVELNIAPATQPETVEVVVVVVVTLAARYARVIGPK